MDNAAKLKIYVKQGCFSLYFVQTRQKCIKTFGNPKNNNVTCCKEIRIVASIFTLKYNACNRKWESEISNVDVKPWSVHNLWWK